MSRKSHTKRALTAAAITAASVAVATPAQASIEKTLSYQCKFPLIAPVNVTVQLSSALPSTWPSHSATPATPVTAKITLAGPAAYSLGWVDGLTELGGKAKLKTELQVASSVPAPPTPADVSFDIGRTAFHQPSSDTEAYELNGSGTFPSLPGQDAGLGTIAAQEFSMNLQAFDPAGTPLVLAPITRGWNNVAWVDSDADPETFDVICRLDPTVPVEENSTELTQITFIEDQAALEKPATAPKGAIAPPAALPTIKSISGRTAFANVGGVAVVNGANLAKAKVTVGGKPASVTSISATSALVVLPALKKGSYDLVVTTAAGSSTPTAATKITYVSLF